MNLIKTSALNGIAVLIKTATMFVLNKILAVYVGPAGYAAIGQFQNFIQMLTSFSGGAINTAVVKYTAEYYNEPEKQKSVWSTAGSIVLILSLVTALVIAIFQKSLSIYIFHTSRYQSIFVWFAVFLLFFNFNALFLAILNGKKEIPKLVIANISGSLFSLLITGLLAYQYRLYGALLALSIYQSLAFFVTFYLCARSEWFRIEFLLGSIDKNTAKKFGHFALMAFVSTLCVPVSQIAIRSYLTQSFNVQYAGYWEAVNRLSGAYLMLVTTTLSVYYLPRLSELKNKSEIKTEIFLGYKLIFPSAILAGVIVYIFRDWIIVVLFSENFLRMRTLFLWQILGDILKIGSWILAYLMLSKAMTKLFIITEVLFSLSLVMLTIICTNFFSFEGAAIAYMINYLFYWMIMSLAIFRNLDKN